MYARDLAGDLSGRGERAVYSRAGELYVVDDLTPTGQPRRLEVTLPGSRTGRRANRIEPELAKLDLAVAQGGRASVVGMRGTVQWLPHRDGPGRVLADTAGVRTRLPRVLPHSERGAVWVTDAEGDDALEVSDGTGVRRLAAGQVGRVLELEVAPDGTAAAVATHDGRVLQVALDSGEVTLVATEVSDASGLAYSPDSRWLAWSAPSAVDLRQIRLAELATGQVLDATPLRFV